MHNVKLVGINLIRNKINIIKVIIHINIFIKGKFKAT